MPAVIVVGAQWGDEGKGKVVDLFTEEAQVVARYAGGANAGHTLYLGDQKVVMRLVPSGVLRPGVKCVLGQGMVVDPLGLDQELDELARHGRDARPDVLVSERAHLVMPYHRQVDALREGGARAIGTTKRGIGPAYEDKAARRGVTALMASQPARLTEAVGRGLEAWGPTIRALGGEVATVADTVGAIRASLDRLVPLLGDGSRHVNEALKRGSRVLLEGAQGTLLDVDHGTYPFVTSSAAVSGGACTGLGIGPTRIDKVVGVTKAYTTRVGEGPFPTEMHGELGQRLREAGGEFGAVTGRPRRTGWLDLPALRYAARVNGLDALAMTKLDILTGFGDLQVCVAYDTPGGRTDELPELGPGAPEAKPVYTSLEGWTESLAGARSMADLPASARAYLAFVERELGLPIELVSVGPRRDETICLVPPFAA